jgi:hypothetical protein
MDVRGVLERVSGALRAARVDHALIGGLALAAHGAGRATQDVDLLADGSRADDVHDLMQKLGYRALHRTENVANYASDDPVAGRVDFLFARRRYSQAMLARATMHPALGDVELPIVDAADLIGLKVQSSSNDASRRRIDTADIVRLLRGAPELDLERVREYFRLFDREKELEALLAESEQR